MNRRKTVLYILLAAAMMALLCACGTAGGALDGSENGADGGNVSQESQGMQNSQMGQNAQVSQEAQMTQNPQTPQGANAANNTQEAGMAYQQITQEAARELMTGENAGIIILDVRTIEEYDAEHIPGAVCIPNETISDRKPEELPDKNQTILVYCRSGRRSKEASEKLARMGYTDIREFGGIIDWQYETITTEEEQRIMGENKFAGALIQLTIGDEILFANPMDNASAAEFLQLLEKGPVTVDMQDYSNFEKVGPLGATLIRSDEQITTEPGDIILYQGSQITIYYDTNSWNFTRLAKIDDAISAEELKTILGDGDVTVTFSLASKYR